MCVRRLDHRVTGPRLRKRVLQERVPDKYVLAVSQFAASGVQQDQRRIEAVTISRRTNVEDPGIALANLKAEEIEVAVVVQSAVDRGRNRNRLRIRQRRIRFLLDHVRLIANPEQQDIGSTPGRDDAEVMRPEGSAGTGGKFQ